MSEGQIRVGSIATAVVAAVIAPFYLTTFWLQLGVLSFAAAVGALGLSLLSGRAGMPSFGHAFFLAAGAFSYTLLAQEEQPFAPDIVSLSWPPLFALIGAGVVAAVLGLLLSPIAGRVRGIYLAIATISLVFIGQHVLDNWTALSGGYSGRAVPPMELFGFELLDASGVVVLGVPFGRLEWLWYFTLFFLAAALWALGHLLRGSVGRAFAMMKTNDQAAEVLGINVRFYRSLAFVISSGLAGISGGLLALGFQQIVPASFSFQMSIDFFVMVVIGGMTSLRGAVIGAAIVTALPQILDRFSGDLPFVTDPGTSGLQAADLAAIAYGVALVLALALQQRRGRAVAKQAPASEVSAELKQRTRDPESSALTP